jgi:hypothetical protein
MPLLKAFSVLFLCSGLLGAQQAPAGKPVERAKSVLSAIDEGNSSGNRRGEASALSNLGLAHG